MPGLGFLFKKKWHPSRMDNEKKLYIKEQTVIDKKTKEIEAAKEIHKERETKEFEELGKIQTRIHIHIYII